jgi:hypothetical protein
VAAALGIAAGRRVPTELAVLLTIAATVVFGPARRALDRLAERRVFGERPSNYEVLARFGQDLEHSFDLAELAPRVADAVRQGLDLRWARVLLRLEAGGATRLQPAGASGIGLEAEAEASISVPLCTAASAPV